MYVWPLATCHIKIRSGWHFEYSCRSRWTNNVSARDPWSYCKTHLFSIAKSTQFHAWANESVFGRIYRLGCPTMWNCGDISQWSDWVHLCAGESGRLQVARCLNRQGTTGFHTGWLCPWFSRGFWNSGSSRWSDSMKAVPLGEVWAYQCSQPMNTDTKRCVAPSSWECVQSSIEIQSPKVAIQHRYNDIFIYLLVPSSPRSLKVL